MKNLILTLALITTCYSAATSQCKTCNHSSDQSCVVYLSEAEIAELQRESEGMEAVSRDDPEPRPYRWLIAYDRKLEDDHDVAHIDSLIRKNAARTERGFTNSDIEHAGLYVEIIPWDFPSYSSIYELHDFSTTPGNPIFTPLLVIKNDIMDMDLLSLITIESIIGKGINSYMSEDLAEAFPPFWTRNTGVVNFNQCILESITLAHEAGHGLGADHETGSNGSSSPWYSRAFLQPSVNNSGTFHSIVKSGNVLSAELEAFSGPNSYAPKKGSGEIVHAYLDSTTNNALAVRNMLNHYWRNNVLLSAEIEGDNDCGNGSLSALSDNADQFTWEVVEGDITLSNTEGETTDYTAMTEGTILLLATTEVKGYSDSTYISVPAIEQITIDTSLAVGSILPDGQEVTAAGTYTVRSQGTSEEGCDEIIIYNVSTTTNTSDIENYNIKLYPNPATDFLTIQSDETIDYIRVMDMSGKLITKQKSTTVDMNSFLSGSYIIEMHIGDVATSYVIEKL